MVVAWQIVPTSDSSWCCHLLVAFLIHVKISLILDMMHTFPLYPRHLGYYIMRLWFLFDHLFCTGHVLVRVHLKVCSAPCRTLSTHLSKSGHCRVWLEAWLHTKPLKHQMRRSGVPIIPASYYFFCLFDTRWSWRLGYTWAALTQGKRARGVSGLSAALYSTPWVLSGCGGYLLTESCWLQGWGEN